MYKTSRIPALLHARLHPHSPNKFSMFFGTLVSEDDDSAAFASIKTLQYSSSLISHSRAPNNNRQLAHDITSALLHDDPKCFADQVRRKYIIIKYTIGYPRGLQLNLKKGRLIDQPEMVRKKNAEKKITNTSLPLQ